MEKMVRDEENNFLYALDTPKKRKLNLKKIIINFLFFGVSSA